jgi:hypothetical protein
VAWQRASPPGTTRLVRPGTRGGATSSPRCNYNGAARKAFLREGTPPNEPLGDSPKVSVPRLLGWTGPPSYDRKASASAGAGLVATGANEGAGPSISPAARNAPTSRKACTSSPVMAVGR